MKKLIPFIIILSLAFGILYYAKTTEVVKTAKYSGTPKIPEPPRYPLPPEVADIAQRVGIDTSLLSQNQFHYGSTGLCTKPNTWACYSDKNIWIADISHPRATQRIAHEYLHFIWYNKLTSSEMQIVLTDRVTEPSFLKRLEFYTPTEVNLELFSITCTEVSDYKLTPRLLALCSKYLPNRSALPSDF